MISMISAIAENRVIGNKNTLPWHLPADFKYFKEKTLGKTIIFGLNTFKSIGEKPLPGRKHIILNKDANYKVPEPFGSLRLHSASSGQVGSGQAAQGKGCLLATSLDQALELSKNDGEVMVCGGASVYKQFLPLADRLYLTYIHHSFEGDTFFPEFNEKEWKEVSRQDHKPDEKNAYPYSFVVLERKSFDSAQDK